MAHVAHERADTARGSAVDRLILPLMTPSIWPS